LDYQKRTDALAAKLGVDINELPDIIGVSRASLFAYRSGRNRVSQKAWAKLTEAEEVAGMRVREPGFTYGEDGLPLEDPLPLESSKDREIEMLKKRVSDLESSVIALQKSALLLATRIIEESEKST
jgi:hypothetical protein